MTVFKAHFDGQVLIPDNPVNLPTDCVLEVRVSPVSKEGTVTGTLSGLAKLAETLPVNPDAPTDGAAQHDHYLYGSPKRS